MVPFRFFCDLMVDAVVVLILWDGSFDQIPYGVRTGLIGTGFLIFKFRRIENRR